MQAATHRLSRSGFYSGVLFVAGFSFLVFEVGWQRLLALVLGSTVSASALVLAAYMAGFGLGARLWSSGQRSALRQRRLAACLLAGVGLTGLLNLLLFRQGLPELLPLGLPQSLHFSLAALLLLLQSLLMGGLFPLLSGLAVGQRKDTGQLLGRLYALESLGSALGALLCAFVLLGTLGQQNTILLAVGLNLLLASLLVTRRFAHEDEIALDEVANLEAVAGDPQSLPGKASVLALVCGFSMLAMQVLWMRAFRVYFTNTSYSFALIAALVILGLFVGGFLFASVQRRYLRSKTQSSWLETRALPEMSWGLALFGILALLGTWLLLRLPQSLMLPLQELLANPFLRVFLLPGAAALLIVLPPAVCSGYLFPLACTAAAQNQRTTLAVGRILSANTAGALLGPLLGSFVLLPLLGVTRGLLLLALLPALLGLWFSGNLQRRTGVLRSLLAASFLLGLLVLLAGPKLPVLPPSFALDGRELLYHRESIEGTLSVGRDHPPLGHRRHTFVNNSQVIGATYDAVKVVKMIGHLPFLLGHPAEEVLVIGFGIGVTTSAIASHAEVRSIECVELLPGLREAAAFYEDLNLGVARDPRLQLQGGDGRQYLAASTKKYDLISCDPTHPILGSASLYTQEYFEDCRAHLKPNGLVSQYLPLHKLGEDEFLGLVATFAQVFPHSTLWLGHYHAILLGGLSPLEADFPSWESRVAALAQDEYFYQDAYHLAACLMLDSSAMQELAAVYPANREDRSYTEFFALSCLSDDNLPANLEQLHALRVAPGGFFRDVPDAERLKRYRMGNEALCQSLIHKFRQEDRQALAFLREACRLNPENEEYPFLIRLEY